MEPVYLDCNATTPLDPAVQAVTLRYLLEEYGNSGSRTHIFGARAKQAVEHARRQVAGVCSAQPEEVLFTAGATESNNLAILGLAEACAKQGRRHVITTAMEHKAVLEPVDELQRRGFAVTRLEPGPSGRVTDEAIREALRAETGLVSVMHANNETGIVQPLSEIADVLKVHPAYFHVDAAQGFGKDLVALRNPRIDLISVSGHKLFAPKGIGALIARRRGFDRVPLQPLMWGGGQERGLRPGTLPVHLVAALGEAAERAEQDAERRRSHCIRLRQRLLEAFAPLAPVLHGDQEHALPHVLNLSFPGVNSEAAILAWKPYAAISNGSACTSQRYTPSHVLQAMHLPAEQIAGALRLSWCHLTPDPDVAGMVAAIRALL